MSCILLAIDGSANSHRATEVAAELSRSTRLPIWVVNVTDHVGLSVAELAAFSVAEHLSTREAIESVSAQFLGDVKTRLETAGAREVHIEERRGDVATTILEVAAEKDAGMIVVGKRGKGRLEGLLVGSVAQKLVCLAPRTVVVVP